LQYCTNVSAQISFVKLANIAAIHKHCAFSGYAQALDKFRKRRFSRPNSANNGHSLSRFDAERNIV